MGKVTYHGSKKQQEREEKVWTPSEIVQGKNLRPPPICARNENHHCDGGQSGEPRFACEGSRFNQRRGINKSVHKEREV